MSKRKRYPQECSRCGHKWQGYVQQPKACPKCHVPQTYPVKKEQKEAVKSGVNVEIPPSPEPPKDERPVVRKIRLPMSREAYANLLKTDLKAKKKEAKWEEKRKKREERANKQERSKELLWSERHPNGWKKVKVIFPRLHIVIIAVLLCYFMMIELSVGNYDFFMDWFEKTGLASIGEILSSQANFEWWWMHYGLDFITIVIFIVSVLLFFYTVVWRTCFKSYVKYSEGEPKPEGRCYWRTNNMWTRMWDRAYGSPPRKVNTYWINQGKFLNVINPPASLIRLDTGLDEDWEEKGLWKVQVSEKRIRRKVNNSSRHLTTANVIYTNGEIPSGYAEGKFSEMSKKCVQDTTALSFANASTRNSVMQSGLRLLTPGIREAILNDRKQRSDNN